MKKIGIIGAGAMGSGIAQVAASAGHSVVLFDTNADALSLSKSKLANVMDRLVEKGRLTSEEAQEIQKRISYADHMEALSESSIIIEAIIEKLDVKKEVLGLLILKSEITFSFPSLSLFESAIFKAKDLILFGSLCA